MNQSMIVINITGGVIQEIHATDDFPAEMKIVVVDYDEPDQDHPSYSLEIHGCVAVWSGEVIGAAEYLDNYPHLQKLLDHLDQEEENHE